MNATDMRALIRSTLQAFGHWSADAEELVLGTIAHESHLGEYREQIGGGPALGIAQMEPATHDDCWDNYLVYHPDMAATIFKLSSMGIRPNATALINNDRYSILMCRVKYLRASSAIPPASDINAQALYWFNVYNGSGVTAKIAEYIDDYNRLVLNQ